MNESIQTQSYLPHERLDVYRLALEFRRSLAPLSKVRGIAPLRDQLFRAADSVVLPVYRTPRGVLPIAADRSWRRGPIAEGAGRNSRSDKQRHYEIAKGSATERAAALELLFCSGVLTAAAYQERRELFIRIVQMLSRLCGPPR